MYYIYYIPLFVHSDGSIGKIGVSKNPRTRVRDQKYSDFEILEQHSDIDIVSQREIELQLQYFGKRDNNLSYKQSFTNCMKMRNHIKYFSEKKTISSKENVKKATAAATLAGAPSKAGTVSSNKIRICPHCTKEGKGPIMFRFHFDNCKHKNI